jgi:hypothetical protein
MQSSGFRTTETGNWLDGVAGRLPWPVPTVNVAVLMPFAVQEAILCGKHAGRDAQSQLDVTQDAWVLVVQTEGSLFSGVAMCLPLSLMLLVTSSNHRLARIYHATSESNMAMMRRWTYPG